MDDKNRRWRTGSGRRPPGPTAASLIELEQTVCPVCSPRSAKKSTSCRTPDLCSSPGKQGRRWPRPPGTLPLSHHMTFIKGAGGSS